MSKCMLWHSVLFSWGGKITRWHNVLVWHNVWVTKYLMTKFLGGKTSGLQHFVLAKHQGNSMSDGETSGGTLLISY